MENPVVFSVDDLTLEGLLWTPEDSDVDTGVVLCHPHPFYGGDMHNNVITTLAEALQKRHMATLRFNFRSAGKSTGTHGDGQTEQADVAAAVTHLLDRVAVSKVVVVGYSFGAAVGLQAGVTDVRVTTLVGVALPVGRLDASALLTSAKTTLLVMGDQDTFCPVETLQNFVARCQAPPQVAILPGADHFLWGREADVAQIAVEFLESS